MGSVLTTIVTFYLCQIYKLSILNYLILYHVSVLPYYMLEVLTKLYINNYTFLYMTIR